MKSSATNQKIAWFRREEEQGSLDLTPQFQRRPVWTEEQSSYLIDSILNNLPIPEIYIRSTADPNGALHHEVVDGQQRIRSILLFGSNDLEMTGEDVGPRWLGKRFDDLSDAEKQTFWDYNLVVRDVTGASDVEIRDLFRRLNIHSVVLNDQELRHAKYSGRFLQVMEGLADDEWWLDSGVVTVRQIRRMEDVEFISELFVGLIAGPQDKKKSLDEYYENYDGAMPFASEWVQQFERTRDLIQGLFSPGELRKWSGKSDFYTLFLALAPLAQRSPKVTAVEKEALHAGLQAFRSEVDLAKRKDNRQQFEEDIHEYADAVTRAATDRGRRETRLGIVETRIAKALAAREG